MDGCATLPKELRIGAHFVLAIALVVGRD